MTKPFKRILTLDFETRWSSKLCNWSPNEPYTLSKMTTEAYIRDPRFKAFGLCVREYGTSDPIRWVRHQDMPRIMGSIDWSTTAVLCQNSMFDAGILAFIYDIHPCFILDTLSMARAVRGAEGGNSLAKLAEYFGLPPKGHAVHSTDGLEELPPHIERELAEYCKHDVYLCEEIYARLSTGLGGSDGVMRNAFPTKELRLIDMTLKMFTEPKLVLDVPMLELAVVEDAKKLSDALAKVGVEESELASNQQFADILKTHGIDPPMKKSKTTGLPALALAKTDAMFQAMLNGDNEDVALLCEARLRVKSTLERTRAQRFIDIAGRGTLPVPLNYAAAETFRFGGTQNVNLQNMKRGSFLRKAIMAPDGYVIVVGDLRQIEPRVLASLADYTEMLETFASGEDAYATFGAQMFNVPGMTKDSHPLLRQSAKSALLGAGFQLGWAAFAAQLLVGFLGAPPLRYTKADAIQLGVTQAHVEKFMDNADHIRRMMEIAHVCTDAELLIHCLAAKAIIEKYRAAAEPVVNFWSFLDGRIRHSLIGGEEFTYKCLTFSKDRVLLPSGLSLRYDNIRAEETKNKDTGRMEMQYVYDVGPKKQKLYAGRLTNNIVQGTARIIMTDGMLRVQKRYPILGTVHDELLALVPEQEAEVAKVWVREQMSVVPKWMPGIPLDADVGYDRRYGLAKG